MSYSTTTVKFFTLSAILLISITVLQASSPIAHFEKTQNKVRHIDDGSIKSGDVVFRRGVGLLSDFVVSVDNNSLFSHTGIIYKKGKNTFVIHILPDEQHKNNDFVRLEPLSEFLSRDNASGYTICRLAKENQHISKSAVMNALMLWKSHIRYDYDLDSSNSQKLYCTELVWCVYKNAGIDLTDGLLYRVDIPFYQGRYILISTLLRSKQLKTIYKSI